MGSVTKSISIVMIEIAFATGNPNKVKEINALLENESISIKTMKELGFDEDIPETGETLEENASIKSKYLFQKIGGNIISEDTGLEVMALNNAPGVRTARYAGEERDPMKNMTKLIKEIDGLERSAQFRTIISLIWEEKEYLFEGICKGTIAKKLSGNEGFGYDPIFIPEGYQTTFAKMRMSEKSQLSHRGKALSKLVDFLKSKF